VERYRQALREDPTDADSKWNLELAQRLLAEQGGGGGGGGGGESGPAQPDPEPAPGSAGAAMPNVTPTAAEEVLRQAAEREQQVQQQRLRRTQPTPPNVRDW
jgi:hypothetical protein